MALLPSLPIALAVILIMYKYKKLSEPPIIAVAAILGIALKLII